MLVYLSIPFCPQRCTYCCWTNQFALVDRFDKRKRQNFSKRLSESIEEWFRNHRLDDEISAVFVGGGTPTTLSQVDLSNLMACLNSSAPITPTAQITLEASPKTALRCDLRTIRESGYNRMSVGVESFSERNLTRLGRKETAREVADSLSFARRSGFLDLNADILFGYPGEEDTLLDDIARAIELGVTHLSLYPYFPARNTAMYEEICAGASLPSGEALFERYMRAVEFLRECGLEEYIFSLFAKPGHESHYEAAVFNFTEDVIGFGPGAHSTYGGTRTIQSHDVEHFIEAGLSEKHPLGHDAWFFPVMKMLRTARGIEFNAVHARTRRSYEQHVSSSRELRSLDARLSETSGLVRDTFGIRFRDSIERARFYCGNPTMVLRGSNVQRAS